MQIVIHEKKGKKIFEGKRSDTDSFGKIANKFGCELLSIDKNMVVEIGKRKFITDIHDFHNALKNEDWSVFNANEYLDRPPEYWLIPLGVTSKSSAPTFNELLETIAKVRDAQISFNAAEEAIEETVKNKMLENYRLTERKS